MLGNNTLHLHFQTDYQICVSGVLQSSTFSAYRFETHLFVSNSNIAQANYRLRNIVKKAGGTTATGSLGKWGSFWGQIYNYSYRGAQYALFGDINLAAFIAVTNTAGAVH
eukprot:scaffold51933_cov23-Cyclotella_meneghiniana.AAC.1